MEEEEGGRKERAEALADDGREGGSSVAEMA